MGSFAHHRVTIAPSPRRRVTRAHRAFILTRRVSEGFSTRIRENSGMNPFPAFLARALHKTLADASGYYSALADKARYSRAQSFHPNPTRQRGLLVPNSNSTEFGPLSCAQQKTPNSGEFGYTRVRLHRAACFSVIKVPFAAATQALAMTSHCRRNFSSALPQATSLSRPGSCLSVNMPPGVLMPKPPGVNPSLVAA